MFYMTDFCLCCFVFVLLTVFMRRSEQKSTGRCVVILLCVNKDLTISQPKHFNVAKLFTYLASTIHLHFLIKQIYWILECTLFFQLLTCIGQNWSHLLHTANDGLTMISETFWIIFHCFHKNIYSVTSSKISQTSTAITHSSTSLTQFSVEIQPFAKP